MIDPFLHTLGKPFIFISSSNNLYFRYLVFYYGNATFNSICDTMYIVMWFYQIIHLVNTCTYIFVYDILFIYDK